MDACRTRVSTRGHRREPIWAAELGATVARRRGNGRTAEVRQLTEPMCVVRRRGCHGRPDACRQFARMARCISAENEKGHRIEVRDAEITRNGREWWMILCLLDASTTYGEFERRMSAHLRRTRFAGT